MIREWKRRDIYLNGYHLNSEMTPWCTKPGWHAYNDYILIFKWKTAMYWPELNGHLIIKHLQSQRECKNKIGFEKRYTYNCTGYYRVLNNCCQKLCIHLIEDFRQPCYVICSWYYVLTWWAPSTVNIKTKSILSYLDFSNTEW